MTHSTTTPLQLPTVADPAGEQVQFFTQQIAKVITKFR